MKIYYNYIPVQYDEDGLVICNICGKSFNKLGSHLRMSHNLKTSHYRLMFGLDNNCRLMSKDSIELARQRNKENYDLVVKKNLISKGEGTRFKLNSPGRTKDKLRPQTIKRLKQNSFIKKAI